RRRTTYSTRGVPRVLGALDGVLLRGSGHPVLCNCSCKKGPVAPVSERTSGAAVGLVLRIMWGASGRGVNSLMTPNSAIDSDTCSGLVRAPVSARHCRRWAAEEETRIAACPGRRVSQVRDQGKTP